SLLAALPISSAGAIVLLAVVLHNGMGYLLGYWVVRLLRQGERAARTTSIEVGMQNSGLAATLAASAFAPAAALPAAIFSIWHNPSGALLASYYPRSTPSTRSDGRRAACAGVGPSACRTARDGTGSARLRPAALGQIGLRAAGAGGQGALLRLVVQVDALDLLVGVGEHRHLGGEGRFDDVVVGVELVVLLAPLELLRREHLRPFAGADRGQLAGVLLERPQQGVHLE